MTWKDIKFDSNGQPILPKKVKALTTTLYVVKDEIYETYPFPHKLNKIEMRSFLSDKGYLLVNDKTNFKTYYNKINFEPLED
jgi:hypothetical protein